MEVRELVAALTGDGIMVLYLELVEGDDVVLSQELELVPLSLEVLMEWGEYRR